jgi:hypothetical protein
MIMIRIGLLFFLAMLSQSGSNAPKVIQYGFPKSPEEQLDLVISDLKPLDRVSTQIAFVKVLHHAKLSGGVVEVHDCAESEESYRHLHSDDFNGFTVREALNRIVADDPEYKWQIDDRTIDLVPDKGVPSLLDIRLAHFQLRAEDIAMSIEAKLFTEPTVEKAMHDLNLKKEDIPKLYIGPVPPPMGRALDLSNATVFHILNAAAGNHRFPAVWHYSETTGACEHTYNLDWLAR